MELSGWIFLTGAWGIIIYLTVFCFVRVFASEKKEKRLKNPEEDKNYEKGIK